MNSQAGSDKPLFAWLFLYSGLSNEFHTHRPCKFHGSASPLHASPSFKAYRKATSGLGEVNYHGDNYEYLQMNNALEHPCLSGPGPSRAKSCKSSPKSMERKRKFARVTCGDGHVTRVSDTLFPSSCKQSPTTAATEDSTSTNFSTDVHGKNVDCNGTHADEGIRAPQQDPYAEDRENEDEEEDEDDDDDDSMLGGIPWALPAESEQTTFAEGEDVGIKEETTNLSKEQKEDDQQDGDGSGPQEKNKTTENGAPHSHDRNTNASLSRVNAPNRWKQHPDRRKSAAAREIRNDGAKRGRGQRGERGRQRGSVQGTAARNEVGKGVDGDVVSERESDRGFSGTKEPATGKRVGGELDDDGLPDEDGLGTDGHYGPRVEAPPCTVFASREGKVKRVEGSSPVLVVGLDPREQLSFVGAARVRCGRGHADLSGYILRPVPWGPYFEVHSPRWMGLLTVRALDAQECSKRGSSGEGAGVFGMVGFGVEAVGGREGVRGESEGDSVDGEGEVEDAVDRVAKNFPVVVVFRSLPASPLGFLSAQADADAVCFSVPETSAATIAPSLPILTPPSAEGGENTMTGESTLTAPAERDSIPEVDNLRPALHLSGQLRLPGLQVVTNNAAGLVPFTISHEWAQAVDKVLASPPSTAGTGPVLVCGAKGVGKSSMCRFLVNRMLNQYPKVAYMDCDLGQPEFTTPGQVSLHLLDSPVFGPPHANLRRPQIAYFVGNTTSKPEPLLFSAAVRALAEQMLAFQQQQSTSFASDGPPPPIVVNTDGWVKGMGEDLLGAVIDAVRPRHIMQILGSSASRTFHLDRLPDGCEVHRVGAWIPPPAPVGSPPLPSQPSAQDQRILRLLAYFVGKNSDEDVEKAGSGAEAARPPREAFGGHPKKELSGVALRGTTVHDQGYEIAALLAERRPRRVPWRAVQVRVMNGSVTPSLVLHAINGALVGLVAMPTHHQETEGEGVTSSSGDGVDPVIRAGLTCLAETPLAPCVGLGIVRSVDVQKRVLYVLTPEPLEVLRQVSVLVKGSLQLPMMMLYDPRWCSHPYFSSEAVGGEVIKPRKLSRRG